MSDQPDPHPRPALQLVPPAPQLTAPAPPPPPGKPAYSPGCSQLRHHPDWDAALPEARRLRPAHPDWVWEEAGRLRPCVMHALTPKVLADFADFAARHLTEPNVRPRPVDEHTPRLARLAERHPWVAEVIEEHERYGRPLAERFYYPYRARVGALQARGVGRYARATAAELGWPPSDPAVDLGALPGALTAAQLDALERVVEDFEADEARRPPPGPPQQWVAALGRPAREETDRRAKARRRRIRLVVPPKQDELLDRAAAASGPAPARRPKREPEPETGPTSWGERADWPSLLARARRGREGHPAWVWEKVARQPRDRAWERLSGRFVGCIADIVLAHESPPSEGAGPGDGRDAQQGPPDYAREADHPDLPPVRRALARAMVDGAGRYVEADRQCIGVILQYGVPLPSMSADALSQLVVGWLEASRERRLEGKDAAYAIVKRIAGEEDAPLRRWAEETIARAFAPFGIRHRRT